MTLLEAANQALEALQEAQDFRPTSYTEKAITTLRQAIERVEKIVPSDYPNSHQQKPYAFEASMYSKGGIRIDPVTGDVGIGTPQAQEKNTNT